MLHLCQVWFSKVLIELYLEHWLFLEQGGTCWQYGTHNWNAIRKSLGTPAKVWCKGGSGSGVDSDRILRFSFGRGTGVKNLWKNGPGVKRNFWLAKFLTSHHVNMHRVTFNLIYLFMTWHEVHSMNTRTLQNAGW